MKLTHLEVTKLVYFSSGKFKSHLIPLASGVAFKLLFALTVKTWCVRLK